MLIERRSPGFRWRIAADGEMANVDCYGQADRPSLSTQRLINELAIRPRFDAAEAFDDFMTWMESDARLPALLLARD